MQVVETRRVVRTGCSMGGSAGTGRGENRREHLLIGEPARRWRKLKGFIQIHGKRPADVPTPPPNCSSSDGPTAERTLGGGGNPTPSRRLDRGLPRGPRCRSDRCTTRPNHRSSTRGRRWGRPLRPSSGRSAVGRSREGAPSWTNGAMPYTVGDTESTRPPSFSPIEGDPVVEVSER